MTPEDEEFNRIEMESRIKQEYVRSMKQEMVPMDAVLQMRDYIRELEWAIKELRERIVELGGSTKNKWVGLTEEEQQYLYDRWVRTGDGWGLFYLLIEAKLIEKNT